MRAGGLEGRIRPERYGWVIVATLCVTETVTWGIVYYGFPVFLRPMEQDLGASRVAVTGAFSAGLGVSALAAVPVGRWIDRHGARGLMTAGSCLATLLTFAWARVESLPALYAVWVGMGVAMAATLYEPAFAAIVSWFTRGRDRALLTVTLAAGLASTIFMPIEAWLLSRVGWRSALTVLTVVLGAVTIPLHAALLRGAPAASAGPLAAHGAAPARGVTLGAARRSTVFWVLAAAFFVSNFATAALSTHLIPFLVGRGYSATVAATTIGWMGAMQLPGRLLFVPISARLGARIMVAAVFLAQALGIGQLPLLGLIGTLVPFVFLQGAANGMATLARATSLAEYFGARHYGAIAGAVALSANGARAVGPVGASLLWVGLGSYPSVFWMLAASLVLAAVALLIAGAKPASGEARHQG
ncbi:MAG TPA: MFS transporter [Methylomirabilota bacterium]|jgi:MFS family permease|nr:MFS transporter [Methylomirabilota bacterium]